MHRDFCEGVGIARLLNATLLLPPKFEASRYWNDTSGFADIFDVDYFRQRVRGWVDVVQELPASMAKREPVVITCRKSENGSFDYKKALLPLLLQHRVILLRPLASQRSDPNPNSSATFAKRARCQACYRSLRLVRALQEKGEAILRALPRPFVALHLRFEPDMIAYSRCRYNSVSRESMASIERVRGVRQVLGEADERAWRRKGKCPLTPRETRFILQAIRIPVSTTIYLAAGSEVLELHELTETYSRVWQKSDLLRADRLRGLKGSSRAAIDWFVSLHADVYIATFVGNMDKMVVTDRILEGKHRNLVLDRHAFAEAEWQGKRDAEIAELMFKNHRQHVVYGYGLPVSDCLCKA